MQIRLIGKANGVGLSRDINLLKAALSGSGRDVLELPCDRRERKRRRSLLTQVAMRVRVLQRADKVAKFDVNVMLEHVWPQFLHEARCNVLVPNPEWFDRRDAALLGRIDRIWAKTKLTQEIFAARGCRTTLIGFDSEDRLQAEVVRLSKFFHLGGRSELKGTARLLRLWQRHPEWPHLTVVQDAAHVTTAHRVTANNVTFESRYLDDTTLRTMQNSHRFHLCLSEAEGWGHYIAEALSVAALTLTCDAAPMNELVSAERGVLVAARQGGQHNLAQLALFDDEALEAAVSYALSLPPARLDQIGAAGRQWFLDNKHAFPAKVQRAVSELMSGLQRVGS
jgi:hypothetical protein